MIALSNFAGMWAAYPQGTSAEVKARIGGAVNADWVTNTCAVRLSRCLNYAGFPLPVKAPGLATLKGGDGKRYAFRVREVKTYLKAQYGAAQLTHAYEGQGGPVPEALRGRRGIICFDVSGWSDATGHLDLWDGDRCANHGYFERADRVHLWTVPEGPAQQQEPAAGPVAAAHAITASVGAGGVNRPEDVRVIQELLAAAGISAGAADGVVGPATIAAIKAFQRRFATWPDGRVDPGGRTLRELCGM